MSSRPRTFSVLVLIGFAGAILPAIARADCNSCQDAAVAAEKRKERLQTQITYGSIGGGVLGVAGLICAFLNSANKRSKALANPQKRRRPLDPDTPLEYEPPESDPPSA